MAISYSMYVSLPTKRAWVCPGLSKNNSIAPENSVWYSILYFILGKLDISDVIQYLGGWVKPFTIASKLFKIAMYFGL